MSDTALAPLEHDRLSACEETIESGLKTFTDVGNALLVIRDERLYRADYGTFEDYCRSRWGFDKARASKLISAAEAVSNVSHVKLPPANERQAYELSRVKDPEQQREVWQEAVSTAPNGKVTAKHVQEVVDRHTEVVDGDTGEVIDNPRIIKTSTTATRVRGTYDDAQVMLDTFKSINDMLDSLNELKPKQSMTVLVTEAARDTAKHISKLITRIEKGA
jgi:hypothetical protein